MGDAAGDATAAGFATVAGVDVEVAWPPLDAQAVRLADIIITSTVLAHCDNGNMYKAPQPSARQKDTPRLMLGWIELPVKPRRPTLEATELWPFGLSLAVNLNPCSHHPGGCKCGIKKRHLNAS